MSATNQTLSPAGQEVSSYLTKLVSDGKIHVPLLPDVASRVLALSNDPDSDAAQLANLIQGDQALAAHVMRIANSAAYTPNASMVSLQQAIARLGMNLISEIALSASVNAKLFKAPGFEARIQTIWDHAVCTALWGKEVARVSKKNVEAAFLCGLLHSIGRPSILQAVHTCTSKKAISLDHDEVLALEQEFHVSFGSVIVKKWEMPVIVQESVGHYHNYHDAQSNGDQAMVTNAAAKLAEAILSDDEQAMNKALTSQVFADLNLYDDDLERLTDQVDKIKAGMEAMRS